MNAATPPLRWAWATACKAIVVLPLDSGPNSSMIRPRGSPLPPSARSSDKAPVETPSTSMCDPSPSFMMAPAPNVFSIWLIALLSAFCSADNRRLDLGRPLSLGHGDRSFWHTRPGYVRKNSILTWLFGCGQGGIHAFFACERSASERGVDRAAGPERRGERRDLVDGERAAVQPR